MKKEECRMQNCGRQPSVILHSSFCIVHW
jgi:hypothetical protein